MASSSYDNEPLLPPTASTANNNHDETVIDLTDRYDPTAEHIRDLRHKYRSLRYFTYALTLFYAALILLYIFLYLDFYRPTQERCAHATQGEGAGTRAGARRWELFPSLAESDAVRFERRILSGGGKGNSFAGKPSPELDKAWHGMFEGMLLFKSIFLRGKWS